MGDPLLVLVYFFLTESKTLFFEIIQEIFSYNTIILMQVLIGNMVVAFSANLELVKPKKLIVTPTWNHNHYKLDYLEWPNSEHRRSILHERGF